MLVYCCLGGEAGHLTGAGGAGCTRGRTSAGQREQESEPKDNKRNSQPHPPQADQQELPRRGEAQSACRAVVGRNPCVRDPLPSRPASSNTIKQHQHHVGIKSA